MYRKLLVTFLFFLLVGAVFAVNSVSNGDFELGDLTGWLDFIVAKSPSEFNCTVQSSVVANGSYAVVLYYHNDASVGNIGDVYCIQAVTGVEPLFFCGYARMDSSAGANWWTGRVLLEYPNGTQEEVWSCADTGADRNKWCLFNKTLDGVAGAYLIWLWLDDVYPYGKDGGVDRSFYADTLIFEDVEAESSEGGVDNFFYGVCFGVGGALFLGIIVLRHNRGGRFG